MNTSIHKLPARIGFVLILLMAISTHAATWYVSTEGSSGGVGTSWSTAFDTIQAGIDAASNGDVVEIADGTYTGTGNKNLDFNGKAITVRSTSGDPTRCIIDCEGQGYARGFHFENNEGPDSVIEGLTITRGNHSFGGSALRCDAASPTLKNCIFSENEAIGGAGIYLANWANVKITHCSFIKNSARFGGGFYSYLSSPIVENCQFIGNSATDKRIGIQDQFPVGAGMHIILGNPIISNCVFAKNNANGNNAKGGGLFCDSYGAMLTNCTFTANSAISENALGGGLYCLYQPTITNCIIWGNTRDNLYIENPSYTTISYCNIKDASSEPWFGEGCFDTDPLFALSNNFHLLPGSPCIDAGTNNPEDGLPETDHDGNPRLLDGNGDSITAVDVGAYEFNKDAALIVLSESELTYSTFVNESNPQPQSIKICNAGGQTMNWTISGSPARLAATPTNGSLTGEQTIELEIDIQGLTWGTYVAELLLSAPEATNSPESISITLHVCRRFFVPSQFATIQEAINATLIPGDTVEIADGTYTGQGNVNLDYNGKPIIVRSQSGNPRSCVINCQNYGRGFYFHNEEERTSILSGLSIVNGNVDSDDPIGGAGGAILCNNTSPTIQNCIFANNQSIGNGGVLHNVLSSPLIINAIFDGNHAGYRGGCICNTTESCPEITNCTFYGSSAEDRGGAIFSHDSSPNITNSIFWECGDIPVYTIYIPDTPEATIAWCSRNVDPAFIDPDGPDNNSSTWQDNDFRLSEDSPCIDAGNNTYIPADITDIDADGDTSEPFPVDLDGKNRRKDFLLIDDTGFGTAPIVDIGAFEYQPPLQGDIDNDGEVDDYDLYLFNLCLNGPAQTTPPPGITPELFQKADLNRDTHVDLADFMIFQQSYGATL